MTGIAARFSGSLGSFALDVDFSAPASGITALFGPSGCGKTSVLRCIAGLTHLGQGFLRVGDAIWQDGRHFVPVHRRAGGYVFQEASLFAHLSVRGNLDFAVRRRAGEGLDLAEVANLLGLEALLERAPAGLSGGERQRVAIGRALLSAPRVLLLDEPLAGLDRMAKGEILPYLDRLNSSLAIPILYVSHDMAEVERLADHMVLMEAGRVRTAGPLVDLVADPALPFAAAPDAAVAIEGTIVAFEEAYGLTTVAVRGGTIVVPGRIGATDERRRLRIVASDVALAQPPAPAGTSILNALKAIVVAIEPMDDFRVNVFLKLGEGGDGDRVIARVTRKSADALGLAAGVATVALVKSVALVE